MFSFLKRFFGKMARMVQASPVEPVKTVPAEPLPFEAPPAYVPPIGVAPATVGFAPAPVQLAPAPLPPLAPEPTISEDFLRGSVFDDDDEEEILPGDRANLGMVPSIGNPHAYMVGLVGEQYHREAVDDLNEGMAVTLELEPGNPEDPSAIAAVDAYGRVIGYISSDSWLREAVYGGGSGFSASVLAVELGDRGFREVVLEVEPSEYPLRERAYEGR